MLDRTEGCHGGLGSKDFPCRTHDIAYLQVVDFPDFARGIQHLAKMH